MLIVERASRRARAVSRFARLFSRFNRRFSDLSCRTCLRFCDFTCRCWLRVELRVVALFRFVLALRVDVPVVVRARFVAVCLCRAVVLERVLVVLRVARVLLEVELRGRVDELRVELLLRVLLVERLGAL